MVKARDSSSKRLTSRVIACALTLIAVSTSGRALFREGHHTETPIQHVIIVVGENRAFDHLFGAYKPPRGQTISNLLSKGIINVDGSPGPHFHLAEQYKGSLIGPAKFSLTPTSKTPYNILPPPLTGSAKPVASDNLDSSKPPNPPPFKTLAVAQQVEGVALLPQDLPLLLTGATGLPVKSIDTRIANVHHLPSGPFQYTPGLSYDAYAASPVHRFYQGWQQSDCSVKHATRDNPAGCLFDLYPWVEVSIGAGSNGKPRPLGFDDTTTGEGSTSMGFYNTSNGDVAYFTSLAKKYSMSDNYHQPVMGGTGANSIMLGYADALHYTGSNGNAATPPADQIENPDPQEKTDNWYTQDGYGGGSYSNCSDISQPGVGAILSYLASLPYKPKPNCEPDHYYLLNNYAPGYNGDGTLHTSNPFTIPPSPVRSIADVLLQKGISWKYYGEGWDSFVDTPNLSTYCNICNPFLYETAIMTNAEVRTAHLTDLADLYEDITNGRLPAVSYVKPGGFLDGHATNSKFDLFEAFTKKIVEAVEANHELWASTAILITVDEGGGYYDSGYIQPLDFFGDGPRIPLIVVSPYSRGGRVVHEYSDHVSILKFIERNWQLPTITKRSRDNLPNPRSSHDNPYVPTNSPAIDDLFSMFRFDSDHDGDIDVME